MPVGTVKWYDCKKGFGFIVDASGEDVFVHFSVIEGDGFRRLFDREKVEYEATRGPKGLQASRVRRTDNNPPKGGKGKLHAPLSKPHPPKADANEQWPPRPPSPPSSGNLPRSGN
jgi:CspA family cold shock protein